MEAGKFAPSSIVQQHKGGMEDRGERVEGELERLREDKESHIIMLTNPNQTSSLGRFQKIEETK